MDNKTTTELGRHFGQAWQESVDVIGLGRVKVKIRRFFPHRAERGIRRDEGDAIGCFGEILEDLFSAVTWPFVIIWGFFGFLRLRRRISHQVTPTGPREGSAYQVAEFLKQRTNKLAIVKSHTKVAIVEISNPGAMPTIIWLNQGEQPQWKTDPQRLRWPDGSSLLFVK